VKAYLITTGSLFGLIALAHVAQTVAEAGRLAADPWKGRALAWSPRR
jgi:hypothetical protein